MYSQEYRYGLSFINQQVYQEKNLELGDSRKEVISKFIELSKKLNR